MTFAPGAGSEAGVTTVSALGETCASEAGVAASAGRLSIPAAGDLEAGEVEARGST
jgi:hypothetical protein